MDDETRSQIDDAFSLTLRPHRSLSPRGVLVLIAALLLGEACLMAASLRLGVWPVAIISGGVAVALPAALLWNCRDARRREEIVLSGDALVVTRTAPSGVREQVSFPAGWVRVGFEETDEDENRLWLASHGRRLTLGRFLGPKERRAAAEALAAAVARRHEPIA